MDKVFDTIKARYSVRTYGSQPVEAALLNKLEAFLAENKVSPFGSKVRFQVIHTLKDTEQEMKQFISYGNIKGARLFIAGCVEKGPHAMEDFGYTMEKNVLMATSLGLGTVWLAGSPKRSAFADKLKTSENEIIPAITPLGHAADKKSFMDRALRTLSGGNHRKPFGELFYSGGFNVSLDMKECGLYAQALEAVRLAPSASNKQPWRIVKETGKNTYHFYMDEHFSNSAINEIKIQNNDMGIGMCHFELTARESGLEGSWKIQKPAMDAGKLIYIVSWIG